MGKCLVYLILWLILAPVPAVAAGKSLPKEQKNGSLWDRWDILSRSPSLRSTLVKAQTDTIYLLGGPDRLDGKFENASGQPEWHGWTGIDVYLQSGSHWHIDDFNCELLDTHTPDNHAWWCGEEFPPCHSGDLPGGYGDYWISHLNWHGAVPDPSSNVIVRVTARLNYETEPSYDFLYFDCITQNYLLTPATYNGTNRNTQDEFIPVDFERVFTLTPGDYVGDNHDEVFLRWRFESDFNFSDYDCNFVSDGAAQIDQIKVYFDQGEGEYQVGSVETCEPGDPVQWTASTGSGCGNFTQIWPLLDEIDPCHSNSTPQIAFIDDGIVVPGTGGFLCTTWCYGPGGYIFNPEGGLLGPEYGVNNEIWSPILPWPGGEYVGASLEFDAYIHENSGPGAMSPGIYSYWKIRSTASTDPTDESAWDAWSSGLLPWGMASYIRYQLDAKGWVVDNCTYVQVAIGAMDYVGYHWGYDGTPAPYFDNVAFKVYPYAGPDMFIWGLASLAQDNFPEIGTIDYQNLGANNVRFDMVDVDNTTLHAYDALRLWVDPLQTGAELVDDPKMYYKVDTNPLFDPYRNSGSLTQGFVYGDSLRNAQGDVYENWFTFDLPDTGFLYPGDIIHYYFEGQDQVGGDVRTSLFPADTTGFSLFPGDPGFVRMLYPQAFTMRALPSLHSAAEGDQPPILLWHDRETDESEAMNAWSTALANLGYQEGVDYDLYWTHGAITLAENGIGWRCTSDQLRHYQTLLYASGAYENLTLNDIQGSDRSLHVLDSWLRQGQKNMFLTGDSMVYDMWRNGTNYERNFVNNWISVSFLQKKVGPLIENQLVPTVRAIPGNPVFGPVDEWIAYGGCPTSNFFDAVLPAGNAEQVAEFTDPSGQTGVYPYAAAIYHHQTEYDARIVYLPYDFNFIRTPAGGVGDKTETSHAVRTQMLESILLSWGHMGSSAVTDVPLLEKFTVTSYPNPFNPQIKISYFLPLSGQITIKIYNVRGELVKTLIDEEQPAGPDFVTWDGTNHREGQVASGIYFYQASTEGETLVDKVTLVK